MFIALISIVKHNSFDQSNWRKIKFDQSIFAEIEIILGLFDRFNRMQKTESQRLDAQRKKETTNMFANGLPQRKQFDESNTN